MDAQAHQVWNIRLEISVSWRPRLLWESFHELTSKGQHLPPFPPLLYLVIRTNRPSPYSRALTRCFICWLTGITLQTQPGVLRLSISSPHSSTATSSCPAQTPGEVVPYSRVPKLTRLTFQTKTQFIQNAKKLCTESAYSSNKIHILCKSWIHWSFREVTARAFMNEATWSFICFIIQSFTDGRLSQHHYSTMMYLGFPETRATSIHMSLRTKRDHNLNGWQQGKKKDRKQEKMTVRAAVWQEWSIDAQRVNQGKGILVSFQKSYRTGLRHRLHVQPPPK